MTPRLVAGSRNIIALLLVAIGSACAPGSAPPTLPFRVGTASVQPAVVFDTTPPLAALAELATAGEADAMPSGSAPPSPSFGVEQSVHGTRPSVKLISSFDGLGVGFAGPQGSFTGRNPSDNTLAVGPNHIVEIVNTRMAVYTRKGEVFDSTGRVLYGPVPTNTIWAGFGGPCEARPNGDAVARYDQLAGRWLYVMPIFRRPQGEPNGPYSMCYAVSAGADPLGPFYRYEYKRPLFPDYPRPAIWIDGYYVPTSTGDHVIQKHACVVDRAKMLQGLPATEQCIIIDGVNFLNNADIDGHGLPPAGAPNIMMATGGTQLQKDFDDDGIYAWKFHVDWEKPSNTRVTGPEKIPVAPYQYLCNGQLTNCVPQPGTERRLDAQGDKLMSRLVYRNIGGRESIVGLHSVNSSAGGGGVRWYEFRLDAKRDPYLHQQSTYAPDGLYRWMGSIAIDRAGNIGIGYSFGGTPHYAGQRFAARLANDSLGLLTFRETVLVEGQEAQSNTLRWEDYTTTAMDPNDDCTIWYVGDYLKKGAASYTTRIGAFRIPGCLRGTLRGAVYFDIDHDGHRDPGEPGLAGQRISYSGGQNGTLTTDATGAFTTWLPADPAYFAPTYVIARPPVRAGWTPSTLHSGGQHAVTVSRDAYTVRLSDRDDVSTLDFGSFCMVQNTGGAPPAHWASSTGETMLASRDAELRRLINMTLHLVNADSSRFTVRDTTIPAYGPFRTWLASEATSNPSYALSAQLVSTALNVSFGNQDGNAAVHDPIANDWLSINDLVTRVSAFIAAHPNTSARNADRRLVERYVTLLEQLNTNAVRVTPSNPERCARQSG